MSEGGKEGGILGGRDRGRDFGSEGVSAVTYNRSLVRGG